MYIYFTLFFICVLVIVLYGLFRCYKPDFSDPLAKSFSNDDTLKEYLDGWAFLHLFFYLIITYLYPEKWAITFIMGVIWELVELSSKDKPFYIPSCFYMSKDDSKGPWWYGRYQDIIMNTIGQIIGYSLAHWLK